MELVNFREKLVLFLADLNKYFSKSLIKFRNRMQLFLEEKEFIRKADPDLEENLGNLSGMEERPEYFDNATEPELIDHTS